MSCHNVSYRILCGGGSCPLKDMQESLDNELQDPEYAALYLNDALHDGSPDEFLLALKNIIRATTGMSQVAAQTELGRESLYKALSDSGNPHFLTVHKVISALGFQFAIAPAPGGEPPA